MWIRVEDAPRPFWVDTDECRLPNGELAFAYENLKKPAIPRWFTSPTASMLRGSSEMLWAWYNLREDRSLRGNLKEVLAFYEDVIANGGLAKEEYTRPRAGHGFSADNRKRTFFNLDLYEHGNVIYWTVELGIQVCEPKPWTRALLFKSADEHCVVLRHPKTSDEYWIPVTKLRDGHPSADDFRQESVLWSSLPAWLQFDFEDGLRAAALHVRREDGTEDTQITIVTPLGDAASRFESYLNSLDTLGFDASGVRPSNTYYVSLAVNGRYRYAHISCDSGEKALIGVHDNSYDPTLFVRYYPSPKGR